MAEVQRGREALRSLASRFPQLYVAVSEDSGERYAHAARRGIPPEGATLDHFQGSASDELAVVDTPAGPVEVLTLGNRADFETFLQIIGHKAQPTAISPEVGAITYRGLTDWGKVADELARGLAEGAPDIPAAFARIAADPQLVHTELVVISAGPYSNVSASETPYGEDEWLRISHDIRLYHECAHIVCRRLMPEDILPVWDEVTADVTGLVCATGAYNAALAARFLGTSAEGYVGGRLEEYLDEGQRAHIDKCAREVYIAQQRIAEMARDSDASKPFDFLLTLKRDPLLMY